MITGTTITLIDKFRHSELQAWVSAVVVGCAFWATLQNMVILYAVVDMSALSSVATAFGKSFKWDQDLPLSSCGTF